MRRICFGLLFLAFLGSAGCAPLAKEHQADAAFRSALTAQLGHEEDRAELLYKQVLALGLDWSPVWNNLAVIAVHRHHYSQARKLLAQAVAANDRDVVALTNYGVMSYHLFDFAEARKTLVEARALRRRILDSMSEGHDDWAERQYARATEQLERTAQKYLTRIDSAQASDAPPPEADLVADLQMHDGTGIVRF
jgi:Tfp pilus assembly protein PilF